VQDALPIVILAVVAVAAVIAVLTAVHAKGVYDDIRAGDLLPRTDSAREREEDIAQLREALARRDVPPRDRDG
jgi:hypothetical protein